MVKNFLKVLWWRFLVPRSERLLVSSATLLCKTQNISTLSMLVWYNTNIFFLRGFSLRYTYTACLICSVHQSRFYMFVGITFSFWSFIVSCCSLILLLPNVVSSEGLFRWKYFQICLVLGQFLCKYFLYCSGSACSDSPKSSG